MPHENEALLRKAYALFAKGDIDGFVALCAPDIVFRVPGSNPLSGEHTWPDFIGRLGPAFAAIDNSFREEVLNLAANESDGFALVAQQVQRAGATLRWNAVHHWRIKQGKLASFHELTDDERTFNAAWAAP